MRAGSHEGFVVACHGHTEETDGYGAGFDCVGWVKVLAWTSRRRWKVGRMYLFWSLWGWGGGDGEDARKRRGWWEEGGEESGMD